MVSSRTDLFRPIVRWFLQAGGPFLGLVLTILLFAWLTRDVGTFMTAANWRTIGVQSIGVGIAALGMTMIMIAGGIDLSVGSVVALVTVFVVLLNSGFEIPIPGVLVELTGGALSETPRIPALPLALAMLGGVLLGGCCGLVNGLLVTRLRIVPFIVTLGTMKIFRGLAQWSAGNTTVYIDRKAKAPWFRGLMSTDSWLPEPLSAWLGEIGRLAPAVWVLFGLSILISLLLNRTLLGRHFYAVGSNEATAKLCGLNVPGTKLAVYGLGGLLTGIAGLSAFVYLDGAGDPTTAEGMELEVIAAVVIGGGSLRGGEGRVLGTLLGVLIIAVLENGCVHCGIPNAIQDVIVGAIIVAAVTLDRFRRPGVT